MIDAITACNALQYQNRPRLMQAHFMMSCKPSPVSSGYAQYNYPGAFAHADGQCHVQAMFAESACSQFKLALVYGNLPTKSLHIHIVSHKIFAHRPFFYLLVPLPPHKSTVLSPHFLKKIAPFP